METGELVVSTTTVIRVLVLFVFLPVGLISYWWLIPRLTPANKRLACGLLVAQIFVIVMALEYRPKSEFERWLWHPDMEWNVPSILSSTQLALVGGVALITAWLARARPAWQRVHLLAIGLFILFLGLDEFFSWKSFTPGLQTSYIRLGVAVAVGTMIVAAASPRRERIWLICLLTGFALIALGALVIDKVPRPCGSYGPLRFDGCMRLYIVEESLEFMGSWLALVAMLGAFSATEPTPKPLVRLALYAVPVFWILFLTHYSPSHDIEVSYPDQPASVKFESGTHLYGSRMESGGLPSSIILRLPDDAITLELGYSIHLVDQISGDSIASRNDYVDRKDIVWPKRRGYVPLYRQSMEVEIPPQAPVNRALWVVLLLWREKDGDYVLQEILASDHRLLSDTQVILDELIIPSPSASSSADALAVFDNGFTLDAVELPEYARAGETLNIPVSWRSDVKGSEDHVQFLHFGHEESGAWWVYDQQPLGPRLPTRLWYSGLADSESGRCRSPLTWRPGDIQSLPGCIAQVISSACQLAARMERLGLMPVCRWALSW